MTFRHSALNLRDGFLGLLDHMRSKAADILVVVVAFVVTYFGLILAAVWSMNRALD